MPNSPPSRSSPPTSPSSPSSSSSRSSSSTSSASSVHAPGGADIWRPLPCCNMAFTTWNAAGLFGSVHAHPSRASPSSGGCRGSSGALAWSASRSLTAGQATSRPSTASAQVTCTGAHSAAGRRLEVCSSPSPPNLPSTSMPSRRSCSRSAVAEHLLARLRAICRKAPAVAKLLRAPP